MIDLYTVATANGQKASVTLELVGLEYRARQVDLARGEHLRPELLAMNPVGRLPFIRDHGDGGEPVTVYGTLAIALYVADKTGRLMPATLAGRARVYHWCALIATDLGPALAGQFVFTQLAPERVPYAIDMYENLSHRLLGIIDEQLERERYIAGRELTIADALAYPIAVTSAARLEGGIGPYRHLARWAKEMGALPAVQRGMAVSIPP